MGIWPKRGQANGVLFLHHRRNPAGQERLAIVGIEMQGVRSPGDDWLVLRGYVCRPASFQPGSRLAVPTPAFISPRIRVERQHEPVRFYVGQPDPDDPTHLTIGVEAQGQRSVIDGWLRMPYERYPAEHIELKLRNPGRFTIDGL